MILCSKISHMIEGNGDRHLVQMVLDDDGQTLGQLGDPAVAKKAELDLHDKMKTMVAEKGVTYHEAFRAVHDDRNNSALKQVYAGFTQDRLAQHAAAPDPDMTSLQAGWEIDLRAAGYMYDHSGTTYLDAKNFVLGADPEIKATYGSCQ